MTTSAHLEPTATSVLPGEEARVVLELRNSGDIVEAYHFEVLGAAAAWSSVEPAALSLYPGTAGQVTLLLRPPRDVALPAGPVPFAVRVQPQEQPQHATVPEGVVELLPVDALSAELAPQLSQGRGSGRIRIAVDNRGNLPVSSTFSGSDRGEQLTFTLPAGPTVTGPGLASFVPGRIRPRKRIWRGQPVPHAFQLVVTPDRGAPIALDGTFVQQPVLPKGLLKAVIAAVALAAVLAGIWFGLLRPAVRGVAKDAAKGAVAGPVETAQSQAAEAKQKAAGAESAAAAAQKAAGQSPTPAPSSSPTATPATPGAGPAPGPGATLFSSRLRATAAAGAQGSATYAVPEGRTLRLTDLVLENPQGDSGTVTIAVDGNALLAPALENFREQDFHWASPIVITANQKVTVTVDCRQVGHPASGPTPTTCASAALISGSLE
ncbi:hypothetical protein [Kitasatospora sp. NPDC097643]|uniref:COG1470 family protein n=1 Tax=Kitasatospora sp. NPDC097643 TaxID=3157230 RepID=UPI0033309C0E